MSLPILIRGRTKTVFRALPSRMAVAGANSHAPEGTSIDEKAFSFLQERPLSEGRQGSSVVSQRTNRSLRGLQVFLSRTFAATHHPLKGERENLPTWVGVVQM